MLILPAYTALVRDISIALLHKIVNMGRKNPLKWVSIIQSKPYAQI